MLEPRVQRLGLTGQLRGWSSSPHKRHLRWLQNVLIDWERKNWAPTGDFGRHKGGGRVSGRRGRPGNPIGFGVSRSEKKKSD